MISAPALLVIFKNLLTDSPGRTAPRSPVSDVEADDQVGRFTDIRALVNLLTVINIADRPNVLLLVVEPAQAFDDLLFYFLLFLTRLNDPLSLTASQIQIDPAQAEGISLCFCPLHVPEPLGSGRLVLHR